MRVLLLSSTSARAPTTTAKIQMTNMVIYWQAVADCLSNGSFNPGRVEMIMCGGGLTTLHKPQGRVSRPSLRLLYHIVTPFLFWNLEIVSQYCKQRNPFTKNTRTMLAKKYLRYLTRCNQKYLLHGVQIYSFWKDTQSPHSKDERDFEFFIFLTKHAKLAKICPKILITP